MSRIVINPGYLHDGGGNTVKKAFDNINTMFEEIYGFMAVPSGMRYAYFEEGANKFRTGVRDGEWVLDQTITATGFEGIEDVDWSNIRSEKLP